MKSRLISISLPELRLLCCSKESFFVILTASWCGRKGSRFISRMVDELKVFNVVYVLESNGRDIVEDFAVSELRLSALPAILHYRNASCIFSESNDFERISQHVEGCSTFQRWKAPSYFCGMLSRHLSDSPLILFIAGDRSSVGKSSMCLAILSGLLRSGFGTDQLAYIKPVTQCETDQLVTKFCSDVGISNVGIGPVVFYKGFTRAFLDGETDSSEPLLQKVARAVSTISVGKRIVLVDGVGYPAVGSICGVSNAHVAKTLGCPVLLIGRPGVGDAVDSFNLNLTYFQSFGVSVLGCIFNKLPVSGYYDLASCRSAVTKYFELFGNGGVAAYGFVPVIEGWQGEQDFGDSSSMAVVNGAEDVQRCFGSDLVRQLTEVFLENVALDQLLFDLWRHWVGLRGCSKCQSDDEDLEKRDSRGIPRIPREKSVKMEADAAPQIRDVVSARKRGREDIESAARASGAAGG